MQKALRVSLPVLFSVFILGGFVPLSSAATLNVVSDATNAAYYDAVVKAADRLVVLQNANGSWDWDVTGATGPTATTYLNIAGVTAEGLLSAYSVTNKQAYLDAAKKSGDYIISEVDASSPKKINAYNVLFLYKLSSVSGDANYAAKAAEYFETLYSATPTSICGSGCLDSAGIVAGQKSVRGWAGDPSGIVIWDLVPYVEYASLTGDTTHAQELASAIIADANLEAYTSAVTNYDLGLASALKAAALIGDTTNVAALSAKITSDDYASYGTVSDGKVQTTSYMVRAFKLTSDSRAAASAAYLVDGTLPTGGWIDTDGSEYAEADSEAITALVALLPQVVQYYTIQDAVDAAVNGGTINVAAGTYLENLTVSTPITLQSVAGAGSTIISGTGSVITINSDDVTINGFTVRNGNTHGMGIYSADHSGLTITNNIVTGIGNSGDDVMGRGVVIVSSASPIDSITISNNQINNIASGKRTGSASVSASAISVGWSTGTGDITNLVLDGNTISDISADISPWTSTTKGQGANGILINHASGKSGNTGRTVAPQITNNTISNLEGLWAHAIGLEGNTPGAVVTGNIISGIVDNKGGTDNAGVFFQDNFSGNTVTVSENNFNGADFLGVAIHSNDALDGSNGYGYEVNAANNWWGTADSAGIDALVYGSVTFNPWYLNEAKTELSSANEITSFGLTALSVTGVIDAAAHTVSLNVPFETDVAALVPTIAVSTGATVSPDSGVPADFTSPVIYTVTSADGTTRDYTVTVDVAPDAPVISTTAHSVNTDTVDISGTAQADSTVSITGENAVATGIATGGSFTITVTLNQNAVNNLSATATNAANNTSVASASVAITHDNIAPTGTIVINGGAAYTNSPNVTLSLSASSDLSGVVEMNIANWNTYDGWEPYAVSKEWLLTALDAEKTVRVKFKDAAGNETAVGIADTIILDKTAPVVNSINLPAGVYGPGDTIAVTVSADAAGYAANATVNGKSVSLVDAGSGTYTGTYTVEEGDADVAAGATPTASVTLTDGAGNPATFTTVSEVGGEVVIDTTAPVIELNGDNPQTVERTTAYVEAGATATDNYDSDISDSIITISSAVNTAVVGSYTVTYDVSDTNGNAATQATRTVAVVDTTAPAVTKLGDGTVDYAIAAGASTELAFSEPIDAASQTAVENALTAGASATPASYSWSGATLTITASAAGLTFANDVKVTSVRDAEANASGELTLVDSAIEPTQTVPDESGAVTVDSATPQVVITSPTQAIEVTVNAGTTDASLDFGSLVTSGTGTLPQVTITAASLGNAQIEIPADTVVTSAENTWDGVMSMPTVTSVALPALTGETKTLGMALEIGYPNATLTFSKGVRLLLPGQTGKRVGYTPAGGTFTEITSVCAADDQATGDALASDSECKKDIGTDMVVWTKHFSTFSTFSASIAAPVISLRHVSGGMDVSINAAGAGLTTHYTTDGSVPTCSSTEYGNGSAFSVSSGTVVKAIRCDSLGYSSAVASSQTVASGSGSGSGGGGGGGSVAAAPAVAATPTVSPATPATPAQGRVLGAGAYNFTNDMHLGSTGADVTELQKVLIAGGFDIPAITKGTVGYGYFGGQTLSAVIAYQKARGISPARGYVSTLTRAELNKGSVGASEGAPAAGKSNLTASQADSILALLESFGAEASVVAKVKATLGR